MAAKTAKNEPERPPKYISNQSGTERAKDRVRYSRNGQENFRKNKREKSRETRYEKSLDFPRQKKQQYRDGKQRERRGRRSGYRNYLMQDNERESEIKSAF